MMTSVVRGGFGIFRIAPPLTIEPQEIDLGLEIFDRALPGRALNTGFPAYCNTAARLKRPLTVVPACGFRPMRWE